MQLKTIISSVSAAALAAGMGMASATPPTSQQYPSGQSRMYQHQDTATQVAHEAAAVLHKSTGAGKGQMQQSGQAGEYATSSQPIPRQVADAARCIAVFPNVSQNSTGGSAMGDTGMDTGETMTASTENTGIASCRDDNGDWSSSPVLVKLSSAQVQPETSTQTGMQTGSQATGNQSAATNMGTAKKEKGNAVVLLFTSEDAADSLQDGDVELGDDTKVAPGPTGSTTTTTMNDSTEVVAYQSTPKSGLSGAMINSGKISFDEQVNKQTYGENADPENLLQGEAEPEHRQKATKLIAFNQALNRFAPPAAYRSAKAHSGL